MSERATNDSAPLTPRAELPAGPGLEPDFPGLEIGSAGSHRRVAELERAIARSSAASRK